MKKILLGLSLAAGMLITSNCLAGDDVQGMSKKDKQAQKEEQEKIAKQQRKAEKQRKLEMKKLEKARQKEQAALKRENRKKQAEIRKEEAKLEAEEKKLHGEFEKEHKVKMAKVSKAEREEKAKMKQLEKEKKCREKKEKRRLERMKREEEKHLSSVQEKTSEDEKQAKKEQTRATQNRLADNWENLRKAEVASEYKDGMYSDVYMLPAWPFSSWFFKDKAMFNVNATYDYAKQCYDSNGAPRDITALTFGEQSVRLRDILLASDLLGEGLVTPVDDVLARFMDHFQNYEINFNGKAEKYGIEFDLAKHVLRDDITIGVQIPVLYMRNHLYTGMNIPVAFDAIGPRIDEEALYYQQALQRILKSKGIHELGGSATGLGDITLFGNVEVTTKYVDKIVIGLKAGLPTGKADSMGKLWAPSLSSNGKCTEFALFASMLVNYKKYINPHLFLQASFFTTSHVHKRVPHWINSPRNAQAGIPVGNDLMAMGDRIEYINDADQEEVIPFAGYDSTIRGFADHAISVKYEKGPEFHVRLGNVFDKFISRRGFLDIYYDLRAKLEDNYRAGGMEGYDVKKMQDNTRSIENRIGFEYSHQFDAGTRLKATLNYSFAGTSAPKQFDIGCSIGHSF